LKHDQAHNTFRTEINMDDERRLAAWIGKSILVRGDVVSAGDLIIDGQVQGTIELGDHSLTIGVGAAVVADLVARTITISGAVTGNVIGHARVELRVTGSVDGDITTPRFVMEDGAILRGKLDTSGKMTAAAAG
jgi:cytoskeletal protein CcmA (bactofilin family)